MRRRRARAGPVRPRAVRRGRRDLRVSTGPVHVSPLRCGPRGSSRTSSAAGALRAAEALPIVREAFRQENELSCGQIGPTAFGLHGRRPRSAGRPTARATAMWACSCLSCRRASGAPRGRARAVIAPLAKGPLNVNADDAAVGPCGRARRRPPCLRLRRRRRDRRWRGRCEALRPRHFGSERRGRRRDAPEARGGGRRSA